MKRLFTVLALCLLSITAARAQQPAAAPAAPPPSADQPATAADIDRYFEVMHIHDMMKTVAITVSQQVRKMLESQSDASSDLPPGAQEKLNQLFDRLISEMPLDDMLDAMRPVYMKHLTHGDVDALVAFYSSPTGKRVLAEMPAMSQESMQAASPVLQKYQARVQQEVQDQIAAMQKQAKQKSTITN